MDLLRSAISDAKKKSDQRQTSDGGEGAAKWMTHGDTKRKEAATRKAEQAQRDREKQEEENRRLKAISKFYETEKSHDGLDGDLLNARAADAHSSPSKLRDGEDGDDEDAEPPIGTSDIFRRLRKFGKPVTLFGESPIQRYRRLCEMEVSHHGTDDVAGGQQNVLLNLTRKRASGFDDIVDEEDDDDDDDDDDNEDSDHTGQRSGIITLASSSSDNVLTDGNAPNKSTGGETEKMKKQKFDMSTLSDVSEERVRMWIRKMLKEWEVELQERTDGEKQSADGKMKSAMYRQTRKDIKPLIKKLRTKGVEEDILDKLTQMTDCCMEREYRKAHDMYIKLAIGNAAWPMGVTMVGIHERAGRSKIFTSEIAHILNDETTRKYIQMYKRLMSFCQRRYPANPSQMVEMSTVHI